MRNRKLIKKYKKVMVFLGVILVISLGVYLFIKINSFTKCNDTITVLKNGDEITRNVGNYRYIHIKINGGSKALPRQYKIINPKNEIVKEGNLEGEAEYEGKCLKGEWKIAFNINEDMQVDSQIWCGNLKSKDKTN